MNHTSPKITVITPTYNRANFIVETIESILSQDFKDFEYLILDDGSTDNTSELVKPYLKDSRVKYLKHANQGEPETVNWGWSLAKGEYFTQVNSDDPILPGLFREMVKVLEKRTELVLAYPDFYFIDIFGKIIKSDKNSDWHFLTDLKQFSCFAASPGTFIRKSSFKKWKKIRKSRFKYINDIDMLWDMALVGEFARLPKFLATWRSHDGGISSERWQSIPEIKIWHESYFKKHDLPSYVKNCENDTKKSIYKYFIDLLKQVNIGDRNQEIAFYNTALGESNFKYKNIQIGDNDLIGNKFNGHDLHLYLRNIQIDSTHLVWNKDSKDKSTFVIAGESNRRTDLRRNVLEIQKKYELNAVQNPFTFDILYNQNFLESNMVHYHLINNFIFDITLLPLMTRLKPTVWTIHDPWALGGHCVHHFDCKKWQSHCFDCPYLSTNFSMENDNSALNFSLKREAIQNSKFEVIVASKWMQQKVALSPIFKGKKITVVPFGINHEIFKAVPKSEAKIKLGIPIDAIAIAFRCDESPFKGLKTIEYVLSKIKSDKPIYLLILANKLKNKPKNFVIKEYGWVKDDNFLSQIYSAADLFLMPSTMESFGMMAAEAMSCGTLPIVMDGTALPETVCAPEIGVSTGKDKEDYLKAVNYYISHTEERQKRAIKCLKYSKENFSLDKYLKKVTDVYSSAMNKHKLSFDDRLLLSQLKKHMEIQPSIRIGPKSSEMLSNFEKFVIIYFYKIDKIFPKEIRKIAKKIFEKNKFIRNFLIR